MANTKQAKKMIRKTKAKTAYNRWWKTKVKDTYKTLLDVISKEKDTEKKATALKAFQKSIDKAAKNGIIKKNKVNRMKSQAAKKVA